MKNPSLCPTSPAKTVITSQPSRLFARIHLEAAENVSRAWIFRGSSDSDIRAHVRHFSRIRCRTACGKEARCGVLSNYEKQPHLPSSHTLVPGQIVEDRTQVSIVHVKREKIRPERVGDDLKRDGSSGGESLPTTKIQP
jgi:hypothetical protein